MVTREELRVAVDRAKDILEDCGIDVDVTTDQLWDWLETDPQALDIEVGDLILNPLLVVHELVEIDELLKVGLAITKDALARNPDKMIAARLKAAKIELSVAKAVGAVDHIRQRCADLEEWCLDKAQPEYVRKEYRRIMGDAKEDLRRLTAQRT